MMDLDFSSDDGPTAADSPSGEQIALVLVRLAALPFLLLAIVLASLIYSVGSVARYAWLLAAIGSRRLRGPVRLWNRPVKAHDA